MLSPQTQISLTKISGTRWQNHTANLLTLWNMLILQHWMRFIELKLNNLYILNISVCRSFGSKCTIMLGSIINFGFKPQVFTETWLRLRDNIKLFDPRLLQGRFSFATDPHLPLCKLFISYLSTSLVYLSTKSQTDINSSPLRPWKLNDAFQLVSRLRCQTYHLSHNCIFICVSGD